MARDEVEMLAKTRSQKSLICLGKQTYGYQRGKRGEIYAIIYKRTSLYIKQITNKDILYSTGNCTQYFVIIYKEKNMAESLCCTPETSMTL